MRDVWLTARYETGTTLRRRSFWLTTFLLPAAVLLLVFIPQTSSLGGQNRGGTVPGVVAGTEPMGYVDPGGLIRTLPTGLPAGIVRGYADERQAQAALARAEIDRYYLIPRDYVASGRLTVVETRYQPLRALDRTELITYVIDTGITGDERLARLLLDPTPGLELSALAPAGTRAPDDSAAAYLLPYLLMFVLYLALAMTSGFMLQSVSREKENRTAEVLLASLKPRDLMLGKIAGLSAVGLLQVAVWLAVFFGVLGARGSLAGFDLNISGEVAARVIPWTLAYFLLGYLMYASVYGVLGVLAPTARDANQFVFLAIIPLIVPLLFTGTFSDAPNGALATTLSLFPLTSPIAMVARLGATPVPWWQSVTGLVGLGVFAYLFILLAARLFRAENLLSSRALTWTRLARELRPQAVRPTVTEATATPAPRVTPPAAQPAVGGQPVGRPARRPAAAPSRQRVYLIALAGALAVIVGLSELARGDSAGIVIAAWGIVLGAVAYWRHRKG
jgi:ABC-2 type transport system permease protein